MIVFIKDFSLPMDSTGGVINDKLGEKDDKDDLQNNQDWDMPDFSPFAHVLEAYMQRHDCCLELQATYASFTAAPPTLVDLLCVEMMLF